MKRIAALLLMAIALCLGACSAGGGEISAAQKEGSAIKGEISTDQGVGDYPAAIMVNDRIYLFDAEELPVEVEDSAIIGYTSSYTGTFPEKNGETNFNKDLDMPIAEVKEGIAVLYHGEWHLCTPKK